MPAVGLAADLKCARRRLSPGCAGPGASWAEVSCWRCQMPRGMGNRPRNLYGPARTGAGRACMHMGAALVHPHPPARITPGCWPGPAPAARCGVLQQQRAASAVAIAMELLSHIQIFPMPRHWIGPKGAVACAHSCASVPGLCYQNRLEMPQTPSFAATPAVSRRKYRFPRHFARASCFPIDI